MWRHELPVVRVDDALRVIRALGKHRYVAGRMHFVHALAACDLAEDSELRRWARFALVDDAIDKASRDERLVRRATEEDLCAVLSCYWNEATAGRACDALLERLETFGVETKIGEPFDDDDDTFPLLVDAGFELLPLGELDAERHRGAIEAFGEPIQYEVARFEEQEHLPPVVHLQELPAFGVSELVQGARDGELAEPLALWLDGNETYQDYVIRGVLRAAKIG
ncbi:MAG TPA: hypothetical protein VGH28_08950 [Polyangiaceae bacterium]|jgi:hypothetical protein